MLEFFHGGFVLLALIVFLGHGDRCQSDIEKYPDNVSIRISIRYLSRNLTDSASYWVKIALYLTKLLGTVDDVIVIHNLFLFIEIIIDAKFLIREYQMDFSRMQKW